NGLDTSLMYLRAVGDMLSSASTEMFQAAASRVLPVLELPGITRGNNLLQAETWRNVAGSGSGLAHSPGTLLHLSQAVADAPQWTPGWSEHPVAAGSMAFAQVMQAGNPFSLPPPPSPSKAPSQAGSKSAGGAAAGDPPGAVTAVAAAASDGKAVEAAAEASSVAAAPDGIGSPSVLTQSGKHMLTSIKACCQLLRPLGPALSGAVWQALTQLFDRFLLATFMVLSGINLDTLIMQ
ncbi:hypothetical protein HaLaN_17477, partial [Haematococcus lacustris]